MRLAHSIAGGMFLCSALALVTWACGSKSHPPTTGDLSPDSGDNDSGVVIGAGFGDGGLNTSPACTAAAAAKSSVGCDYYVLPPPPLKGFSPPSGYCLAAFIANSSNAGVKLGVEYKGSQLDATQFSYLPSGSGSTTTYKALPNATIPPKQVAIVMLSNEQSGKCPGGMSSAAAAAALPGTGIGSAFHITTNAPVVAYDLFPYGGGDSAITSATLLLPTPAWDVNYIATTAYSNGIGRAAWLGFVATQPTDITLLAPVAIEGATGVAGAALNTPTTYHLDRGQTLQLAQDADLSGTIVKSTQPIGVWGGNICADVPTGNQACDGMHQQLPPVRALGSRYVGVRYRNRIDGKEESVPWRIVGAVDGTMLTFDPGISPEGGVDGGPLQGPPLVKTGQVLEFNSPGPFVVSSQDADHPFYLATYMTGCSALGLSDAGCPGDPEFVNVLPDNQYLTDYTFFTDPTYPETNLVFIRGKDAKGTYQDVSLDCAGTLTGWTDINPSFQYTRVDLVKGNFAKQGNCDNGIHGANSKGPFGLTVWGWGSSASMGFSTQYVSYAYPAGASIASVNTVVVPTVVK